MEVKSCIDFISTKNQAKDLWAIPKKSFWKLKKYTLSYKNDQVMRTTQETHHYNSLWKTSKKSRREEILPLLMVKRLKSHVHE